MSIAKIIEISAESRQGFDDAVRNGIAGAAKSLHGIRNAWVKDQQVIVEDGKPTVYRVDLKLTFVMD